MAGKLQFRDAAEERAYWEERHKLDNEIIDRVTAERDQLAARLAVARQTALRMVHDISCTLTRNLVCSCGLSELRATLSADNYRASAVMAVVEAAINWKLGRNVNLGDGLTPAGRLSLAIDRWMEVTP